jgi:hypothetical protein
MSLKVRARSILSGVIAIVLMFAFNLSALTPSSADLSHGTYTATMAKPYQPAGQNVGTDDYHCFLIDPGITSDVMMTSIQFIPKHVKYVHHAILFRAGAQDLPQLRTLDNHGSGWSCFGGLGTDSGMGTFLTSPWLSSWVPGRGIDIAPGGYGVPFKAGEEIVLQVHYNLLASNTAKILADQSKIVMHAISAIGSKLKALSVDLIPAPVELACPKGVIGELCDRSKSLQDLATRTSTLSAFESAGLNLLCGQSAFHPAASLTSTCTHTIAQNETIIEAAPHMHLLGRSLKIIRNPGTSSEQVLLNRPNYNFDDQSATILKTPVALHKGDKVQVTCTFDPTLRQRIPSLKKLPPRYVTWGEGSSDEMCLGVLEVVKSSVSKK